MAPPPRPPRRGLAAWPVSAVPGGGPQARLDVWSFNLRTEFQEETDGPNGWSRRRAGVAELIRARRPALVCCQEATEAMLSYLAGELSAQGYQWVGASRRPGEADETAGLLFDGGRLELVERLASWLGPPGTADGALGWDAAFPRTMEMALFRVSGVGAAGEPLYLRAVNTHLDHVGVAAREGSARQIAEALRRWSEELPEAAQVLCGDFNSPKGGNAVYRLLASPSAASGGGGAVALRDAARAASAERRGRVRSTIHKFEGVGFAEGQGDGTVELRGASAAAEEGGEEDAQHIDWILWRDGEGLQLRPALYEVMTECLANGRYPSDHFPIQASFDLLPIVRRAPPSPPPRSRL